MFCSKCGNKLEDGTKFCPNCGNPVPSTDTIPITPQPVENHPTNPNNWASQWDNATIQNNSSPKNNQPAGKKQTKPVNILLIVGGAILALIILISLISGGSDDNSNSGSHGNYNPPSNSTGQSNQNNANDYESSLSESDVIGNWETSMNVSQLFSFLMHSMGESSGLDMGMDIEDFESDSTFTFYYKFDGSGTYFVTYDVEGMLETVKTFYISYFETYKGNKNKFMEDFDISEDQLTQRMQELNVDSFDALIDQLKDSMEMRVELMKQLLPEESYNNIGEMPYKIEGNQLFVYLGNNEEEGHVTYKMKDNKLIPVSAKTNNDTMSDDDLLTMFGSPLVRSSFEISDPLNKELTGRWICQSGGDAHQIAVYSSGNAIIIDGDDTITTKAEAISDTSFALTDDEFSEFVFKYEDGILVRYEDGEPDGYTYMKLKVE